MMEMGWKSVRMGLRKGGCHYIPYILYIYIKFQTNAPEDNQLEIQNIKWEETGQIYVINNGLTLIGAWISNKISSKVGG